MVQPTRIVCCACDALIAIRRDAAAPATSVPFEIIRIIPAPVLPAPRSPADCSVKVFHGSNTQASHCSLACICRIRLGDGKAHTGAGCERRSGMTGLGNTVGGEKRGYGGL